MPPSPPAPQHLVGDPVGVPWLLGRGACRRKEVLGEGKSPGVRGPYALRDFYKVLRIPALYCMEREVLEMCEV